ncbi:squamosa promoter-binding-like protein 13A [Cornus florida]|uniref:squamosa promoter-binding-like protein 13A n=1 Tax=Cornus florida TaxID=4283 RepID=UPI00289E0A62|nr:squamosa promoter-binding-like protein 13A [Cornus florida]XP_059644409.1 squamosa promoter-binding-like protein 13A [Cornus florida]
MDWNLKAPSWDLTEFQQATNPNINPVSESSSFQEQGIMGDFSVDLKLGQVADLGNETGDSLKGPSGSKMALSPSGSSKRARAVNNGIQTASCLVDGCNADLSSCREYHRRHKVCELHSKTAEVTIRGHKQRFCQQCSRFHSLEEFDDGKRSCRKRLDGHNRRRRKPQPEPLSRPGSFVSNYQASRLFPFSAPQVYPTTAMANPVLAGVVKAEQDDNKLYNQFPQLHLLDKQNLFPGSSSCSYKGEKQFSFLHSTSHALNSQTVPEASVCQPLLQTIASSESGRDSRHEMFCDRLSTQVLNSDCALSLLSSPTTQTSGISLSHMVPPTQIPAPHPSVPSLHYNNLEPMNSAHVSTASDTGMFHVWPDSSSDNETPHALPFYWE